MTENNEISKNTAGGSTTQPASPPPQQMGTYVHDTDIKGDIKPFVPNPLPKELEVSRDTMNSLAEASMAMGRLDGVIGVVPIPELWQHFYIVREALDSSRIEGTVTSLSDVLAEQAQLPTRSADHDVAEVRSYIKALSTGRRGLEELPISRRFLCNVHRELMDNPRGASKAPGEFRRVQNQIASVDEKGNLKPVFIPPPVPQMEKAMDELELFINTSQDMPDLLAIGLTHYQFETIHPFIDGNGRTGRLLIIFQMLTRGVLRYPLLALSTFLKEYQSEYYHFLRSVYEQGTYDYWLNFFFNAIREQANKTFEQALKLIELRDVFRERLQRDRSRATELIDPLFANPMLTTARVKRELEGEVRNPHRLLHRLQELNILSPLRRRSSSGEKFWIAHEVFALLSEDERLDLAEQDEQK